MRKPSGTKEQIMKMPFTPVSPDKRRELSRRCASLSFVPAAALAVLCAAGVAGAGAAPSFGATTLWSGEFSNAQGWTEDGYWQTLQFPDVNGDRKADICGRARLGIYCALSTGTGVGPATLWDGSTFSDNQGWNGGPHYWQTLRFPDLNGDGKADVCGRGKNGVYCGLSTGKGFGAMSLWDGGTFSDNQGWGAGSTYWQTLQFPDVNGDGKADVCGRGKNGVYCGLSTGKGLGAVSLWDGSNFSDTQGWHDGPQYWQTLRFPDVNGDGKADVCGRGKNGVYCGLSTGKGFGAATLWDGGTFSDNQGWGAGSIYWQTLQFQDMNKDGKADICGRGKDGVYCGLSTGKGFGAMSLWDGGTFSDNQGWSGGPQYWQTLRFPDVSGDGKADVCGRGKEGVYCGLSTGNAFGSTSLWDGSSFSDNQGWGAGSIYWQTLQFPDVSGDGRKDVCGRGANGLYCAIATAP
jgi:hypothetical protein